jgi:hypothetical protein
MTVVSKSNKPDHSKTQVLENSKSGMAPASDVSVAEVKMYKQAPVITLQASINPLAPGASAHMEAQVKNTKTVESAGRDLGPIASSDSPTLVGNPEVPLKEDGK